jgi:UDP-N-acetylglucosamine diphosphorylase/glucosamine-1-phosphate N-acetyltransferase
MITLTLFDTTESRLNLMPLTLTRPVADLRVGIFTLAEKWQHRFGAQVGFITKGYLQALYPLPTTETHLLVDGRVIANNELWEALIALKPGQKLVQELEIIGANLDTPPAQLEDLNNALLHLEPVYFEGKVQFVCYPWDIFGLNAQEIRADFELLPKLYTNIGVNDAHTKTYNDSQIFVAPGAKIRAAILNAEDGPIFIGPDAEVQEGSAIKGPFALCEHAVVNMGAKMRGDTTVGPYSKVGGEISNSVIWGYSNKGHDGFMGNTVLGQWCNLGADTNTSNLKNNYSNVKIYNYGKGQQVDTGQQFCGLIMGDHSKAGINTMFNTGTVVGVGVNVYGGGFPDKFISSYSWGGPDSEYTRYRFADFLKTAKAVMGRRKIEVSAEYEKMLRYLSEADDLKSLA